MAADAIDYKLIGDDLQGVIITLDPNSSGGGIGDLIGGDN